MPEFAFQIRFFIIIIIILSLLSLQRKAMDLAEQPDVHVFCCCPSSVARVDGSPSRSLEGTGVGKVAAEAGDINGIISLSFPFTGFPSQVLLLPAHRPPSDSQSHRAYSSP